MLLMMMGEKQNESSFDLEGSVQGNFFGYFFQGDEDVDDGQSIMVRESRRRRVLG
jgi:hypothetical protein